MRILENEKYKYVRSKNYNYNFNKEDGTFCRWGKTLEDDPEFAPSPEILDLEISTICSGGCKICYKSNTTVGKNMSFETFKIIFHKLPRTLTQIAFGIGSLDLCPDIWKIMDYCRNNDHNFVVPNITINGKDFTDEQAKKLVDVCGAVAVSRYNNDDCYGSVKKLTDLGLKQTNIHQVLCFETLEDCYQVIKDWKEDERLKKLNAIVFLLMKPKGKRNRFHQLTSLSEYKKLVDFAFEQGAPIGFDSCSASNFLKAVKDRNDYSKLEMLAEPCESSCFSSYINVDGIYHHCSFAENENDSGGIDVVNCNDFIKDIWNSPSVKRFRNKLMNSVKESGCRTCPIFNLNMED